MSGGGHRAARTIDPEHDALTRSSWPPVPVPPSRWQHARRGIESFFIFRADDARHIHHQDLVLAGAADFAGSSRALGPGGRLIIAGCLHQREASTKRPVQPLPITHGAFHQCDKLFKQIGGIARAGRGFDDDIAPKDRPIQERMPSTDPVQTGWVNCTRPNGVSAISSSCPAPPGNLRSSGEVNLLVRRSINSWCHDGRTQFIRGESQRQAEQLMGPRQMPKIGVSERSQIMA